MCSYSLVIVFFAKDVTVAGETRSFRVERDVTHRTLETVRVPPTLDRQQVPPVQYRPATAGALGRRRRRASLAAVTARTIRDGRHFGAELVEMKMKTFGFGAKRWMK